MDTIFLFRHRWKDLGKKILQSEHIIIHQIVQLNENHDHLQTNIGRLYSFVRVKENIYGSNEFDGEKKKESNQTEQI